MVAKGNMLPFTDKQWAALGFFVTLQEKQKNKMKVAIIQHDIRWNETEWNFKHISQLLDQQAGADLYVLTEMFATGFLAEGTTKQAAVQGREIVSWMQQQAHRLNAAIAGSVAIVGEDSRLRNRLFFIRPDGSYDYYDKRHLFSYAGEHKEYTAGDKRVVVKWKGVRILLQICYDLRFPVFSRNHDDYDAIIYVANWPAKRRDSWQILLKARAIENQSFVIGVNRVGSDKACEYVGDSAIINAYGQTVMSCSEGLAESVAAELDMEQLLHFREKFPVLKDTDDIIL